MTIIFAIVPNVFGICFCTFCIIINLAYRPLYRKKMKKSEETKDIENKKRPEININFEKSDDYDEIKQTDINSPKKKPENQV